LASAEVEDRLRGRGEFALAFTTYRQGDFETSMAAARRAIELASYSNDPRTVSYAHGILSGGYLASGHMDEARRNLEKSAETARKSGEGIVIASAYINLGNLELTGGNYALAKSLSDQGRDLLRPYGDTEITNMAAGNLAHACLRLGELDEAEQTARETLEAVYAREDLPLQIDCLRILAGVAVYRGELPRAARLIGLVERLRSEVGVEIEPAERALQRDVMERLAILGEEALADELAAGQRLSVTDALQERP
jgi:tetratricopeptide (TPR) repeat protein